MNNEKLTPWRRFINLLELERKDILQIFNYAVFSGLISLSLPLGIQAIVNLIQGAQISTSWIVLIVLVTFGVAFVGVLNLMQLRIIETIQQRIFVKASFELSYRFPKIKMEALRNVYPPELANRFFDTLTIQKGLSKVLIDVPSALLQVLFALILLSFYHSLFIIFGILLLFAVFFVFRYSAQRGLHTSIKESSYKYKVAHWIQEIARSNISFKLSGKTSLALNKNDELVEKYVEARESHFGVIKLQYIKMIGFKVIITFGLLVIGGMLVLNQQMNIGQFVAAEIIILLVINSIEKLILGLETFYDILTSLEKLGQLVDRPLESQDGEKINTENGLRVELNDVSLQIPDRDKNVLENIQLDIQPNSRILVKGEAGAGKSSLLYVLSGIITPTSGSIFINGFSLKGLHLNNYRQNLGLSLSEEYPFEGTLKDNLTFGDTAISDTAILQTLKQIGLQDFVKELPNGLHTMIFPEGKQISYAIAKKIVLARAILKRPSLLILEDPLDQFSESETKSIIDFLCQPSNPWALVVVSSNTYWEKYCKESIFLKEGKIQS